MKAIWSFWSKPWLAHRREIWCGEKYHLFSWVLSVERARVHYPDTVLYTDEAGERILVEGLGLPFREVNRSLDKLAPEDPGWWALGKLHAYRAQTEPFVHIDSDVYLWNALPEELVSAPVFAQNPEHFTMGDSFYEPAYIETALARDPGGWLPEEWPWFREQGPRQLAPCCGIVGGTDFEFVQRYANSAIQVILHPVNKQLLADYRDKGTSMVLIEQYYLSACLDYHGVKARYLFDSILHALDEQAAADRGFTHLLSDAKRNQNVSRRLEERVQRDYPEAYQRCLEVAEELEAEHANRQEPVLS